MTEWRIWTESVPVEEDDQDELSERFLDALEADRRASGPIGYGRIGSLGAVFLVDASDIAEAASIGAQVFTQALRATRDDVAPLYVQATAEDWEPASFVGATEAGRVLGISRQRIYQLMRVYPDFPKPVATPARGAVWDRRAIEAWGGKARRLPANPQAERIRARRAESVAGSRAGTG
ncbi:MAG: helix-turn-helix transcriptional regulator [Actinomycetota bacterium]